LLTSTATSHALLLVVVMFVVHGTSATMCLSEPELRPVMRMQATLDVHWGKHHRTYVTNLNGQVEGTDMESKSLEEVRARCSVPAHTRAAACWSRRIG
jgi:superoxide dismutase